MENNQTAARAAKRFLDDRVRNDWQYPAVPPAWSASDEEVRDATEFRERYYGESESSDSDSEIAPANGDSKTSSDPYKFDSPDSIGHAVDSKRTLRRRRRRERLEHDMAENEGLRIWVAQRDRWTGAASVAKYGTTRRSASATAVSPIDPPPGSPSASPADTFDVVPVAPRLLADNAIRASVTPKAYPDIFQKIVVSSRTPAVPVNLADLTAALVQGWKDTNEWPPRQGALDPLAGKKRGAATAAAAQHAGFMERHPHLDKGVGSVKKMLHLSAVHADSGKER
jgi:hypothetical protein